MLKDGCEVGGKLVFPFAFSIHLYDDISIVKRKMDEMATR